jgi:predicted GNAT superfamily acetyltransferase
MIGFRCYPLTIPNAARHDLTASNNAMILYDLGQAHDYQQILALNEEAIPAVNRIDQQALETLHAQSRVLIAARAADRLAGFLLALGESARYDSLNFQYFRRHYPQFVYVDRIVVDPAFRSQGIGTGLYRTFHSELGFQIVDHQDTDGGRKRVALMVRSASGET